jgi:methionyl-tRNA synthetase
MTNQEWLNLVTPGHLAIFNAILIVLVAWSLIWKGWALWRAARNNDKVWFIVLLLVNTVGLLEILYLFVFAKREYQKEEKSTVKKIVYR